MQLLVYPAYADELRDHLLRYAGVVAATEEAPGVLDVTLDDSLPAEAARLELDLFLTVWKATRPDAPVEVID